MQLFIVIVTILITTILIEVIINLDYVACLSGNKPTQKVTQKNRRKAWVYFHWEEHYFIPGAVSTSVSISSFLCTSWYTKQKGEGAWKTLKVKR